MEPATVSSLDDALVDVQYIAFDTAPLIYFVEEHPIYGRAVGEIIRRVDEGRMRGCTSVLTLTELLTLPFRHGDFVLASEYRSLLSNSRHFDLLEITAAAAEKAAALRAQYGLRTPDALQAATALTAGCQALLTNDQVLKRVQGLRVLTVAELLG